MKKLIWGFMTIATFLIQSCDLPNEITEPRQNGIKFEILNSTNLEYENAKVIIGGIDHDSEFIEIESYTLPKITKGTQQILDGFDNKRWKPDFNEIRKIGDGKAYFKFLFEGKQANFIEYDLSRNLYIDLAKYEVIDDRGEVKIYIKREDEDDINKDMITGWTNSMLFTQE